MRRIPGQLVKTSNRLHPLSIEIIRLLREKNHFRSDAEVIDWALEMLAYEEGLRPDELIFEVEEKLKAKNHQ